MTLWKESQRGRRSEPRWAAWIEETTFRGNRRALRERFRVLARELPLPTAPLVISVVETFRV